MFDIKEKADLVNNILKEYLPKGSEKEGSIEDAMYYSVMSGGKRLRGIMLIEAFRLFNNDREMEKMLSYPFAAAMEFIHAYSLVHDDLPSMDNDMYRRGVLTTHAKYGHAMGVLTGDALLNYAFETMTDAAVRLSAVRGEIASELLVRAARATAVISSCAGYSGMIGGQVMDVCEENTSCDLEYLYKIYELKTSRLFQAALEAGAILGGADDKQTKAMKDFGYYVGEAFQIKDDILDTTATFEQLGKDINSDEKNDKKTVASLLGIEEAQKFVNEYLDKALELLINLPGNKSFFADLVKYLRVREA